MSNILTIGDVHVKPGVSNERLRWLGRLVADLLPDKIVQIGDFNDMASLSSFDKGKKAFEGRRYVNDCKHSHDALQTFQDPIDDHNKVLRAKHIKTYQPEKFMVLGNHEKRILRAVNDDPMLEGKMSIDDLGYEEYGWQVIPFLEPLDLDGIIFQHYFTSGAMDRPMGGDNLGSALMKRYHTSCFQGHNHLLKLGWESNARGQQMMAGSIGCYFEHEEDYLSRQAQHNFSRGVLYLKGVENGTVKDFEWISLDTIKRLYK